MKKNLRNSVPGLKVAGVSGICHPQESDFVTPLERRTMKLQAVESWAEMVALARTEQNQQIPSDLPPLRGLEAKNGYFRLFSIRNLLTISDSTPQKCL